MFIVCLQNVFTMSIVWPYGVHMAGLQCVHSQGKYKRTGGTKTRENTGIQELHRKRNTETGLLRLLKIK